MFQMQFYIIFVYLLFSGDVSAVSNNVLRQAKFIADINQQFPNSCIIIINSEEPQQGKDPFHIIYSGCACSEQKYADRNLGLKVPTFSCI